MIQMIVNSTFHLQPIQFRIEATIYEHTQTLDELLYKERYSIERTNAWLDSFRTLLNRFDTTISSWKSFNYIAFMVILLKKIERTKKSR